MLYTESIEGHTLDILKGLMEIDELGSFNLVGGTALALRYGHRLSIDIDLFSSALFDNQFIVDSVTRRFDTFQVNDVFNKVGLFGFINDVKIDLVQYHWHPLIGKVEIADGIRIVSDADIAAMKIFAILQRAKKKDMFDMSLLLDRYGLEQIAAWYFKKFPNNQMLISIPTALLYFDETEEDDDPVSLSSITWSQVKKNISKHVNKFLK